MNRIWNYFEMAGRVAILKQDRRTYQLGVIGVRGDGCIVRASNSPSQAPAREAHAEYKVSKKLDHGATVYVVRIRGDGSFGMAHPCKACLKILTSRRVKKVYYTISNSKYGVIYMRGRK